MKEINTEQALEMAHCALINLDNMATMSATVASHPLFAVTRTQLVEAIGHLGRDVRASALSDDV